VNFNRDFSGGDIAAARKSYLSENPIDIWGGFSGIFYSSIPNQYLGWGRLLLILQLCLTGISIYIIYKQISIHSRLTHKIHYSLLGTASLYFSTFLTRDSTSLTFIIFGIALISLTAKKFGRLKLLAGYLSLVVGFSFRPWLAIVGVIILSIVLPRSFPKNLKALLMVAFLLLPYAIDQSAYLVNDKLKKVHPELQVIIMDAGSFSCLGKNSIARESGRQLLLQIDKGATSTSSNLCEDFRINTWQSVGYWALSVDERRSLGIADSPFSLSNIQASTTLSGPSIDLIRNSWVEMILQNPKEYIEIKSIQAAQLLLGADSAEIDLNITGDFMSITRNLLYLPFNLLLLIHGMSILISLVVLFLIGLRSTRLQNRGDFIQYIGITLIPISWIAISAVAFIGDNGRYTYSATLVTYFLLFISLAQDRKVKK
jgi:hypothetical protein